MSTHVEFDDFGLQGAIADLDRIVSLISHLKTWGLNVHPTLSVGLPKGTLVSRLSNEELWKLKSALHLKEVMLSLARCHGDCLSSVARLNRVLDAFNDVKSKEPQ